jgi:hypothetical protein
VVDCAALGRYHSVMELPNACPSPGGRFAYRGISDIDDTGDTGDTGDSGDSGEAR